MRNSHLRNRAFSSLDYLGIDAKSNLEAKRGCRWVNHLIVVLAEFVKEFGACEKFYRGETPISTDLLLAARIQRRTGVLRTLAAIRDKLDELTLPNVDEIESLEFALIAFEFALGDLGRKLPERIDAPDATAIILFLRDCPKGDTAAIRSAGKAAIRGYCWELAEAAYRFSVAEYRIWHEHRDWEISGYESDPNGPFDVRGIYDNLYRELKRWDETYPHAFGLLRSACDGLSELRDDLPVMFVRGDAVSHAAFRFTTAVRVALVLPVRIFFHNPVEAELGSEDPVSSCEVSAFLAAERIGFINRLNRTLQERAKLAEDAAVRRKWYEADAELLAADSNWGQPVFTPDRADRLIALVDAAQRESWIQGRMKVPENAVTLPEANDQPPPSSPLTLPPLRARELSDEEAKRRYLELLKGGDALKGTQIGRHVALVKCINEVMESLRQIAATKDEAPREPTYKCIATAVNNLHKDDPSWKKVTDDAVCQHVERAIGRSKIDARKIASGRGTVSGTSATIKSKMKRFARKREYYTDTTLCLYWAAFILQSKTFAKAQLKRIRAVAAAIQPDEEAFLEAVRKVQQNWRA